LLVEPERDCRRCGLISRCGHFPDQPYSLVDDRDRILRNYNRAAGFRPIYSTQSKLFYDFEK